MDGTGVVCFAGRTGDKGAGRYSDGFPEAWGVTKIASRWTYLIFKSNKKGSNPIRICSQEMPIVVHLFLTKTLDGQDLSYQYGVYR